MDELGYFRLAVSNRDGLNSWLNLSFEKKLTPFVLNVIIVP